MIIKGNCSAFKRSSIRDGNIYPKIQGRLFSESVSIISNVKFGLLLPP